MTTKTEHREHQSGRMFWTDVGGHRGHRSIGRLSPVGRDDPMTGLMSPPDKQTKTGHRSNVIPDQWSAVAPTPTGQHGRKPSESMTEPAPVIHLQLRPLPSAVPANVRLRMLLKIALRRFGLKNVGCWTASADMDHTDGHAISSPDATDDTQQARHAAGEAGGSRSPHPEIRPTR